MWSLRERGATMGISIGVPCEQPRCPCSNLAPLHQYLEVMRRCGRLPEASGLRALIGGLAAGKREVVIEWGWIAWGGCARRSRRAGAAIGADGRPPPSIQQTCQRGGWATDVVVDWTDA